MSVLGMSIEGLGIILAIAGVASTWREFSDEGIILDSDIVQNLRLRTRAIVRGAGSLFRRLRGYPPNVIVGSSHGSSVARATLSGEGHAGYAPLDPALDTRSALAALDSRTRELGTMLAAETGKRVEEDDSLRSEIDELGTRVDRSVDELGQKDQRIAVGGLRSALVGLILVLIGLGVQGVGVVIS